MFQRLDSLKPSGKTSLPSSVLHVVVTLDMVLVVAMAVAVVEVTPRDGVVLHLQTDAQDNDNDYIITMIPILISMVSWFMFGVRYRYTR